MKDNRTSGGVVGGGGRGSFIAPRTCTYQPMQHNPTESEKRERTEELAALLRAAVNYTARQLLMSVPPMQRSKAETQALYDCTKDRRAPSDTTLALLLTIQARAENGHVLSEQIRVLELQGRAAAPCPFEASEAEQVHDAALDVAQLRAAREKSPTYWQAVREKAIAHMAALRHLIDATARYVVSPTEVRH